MDSDNKKSIGYFVGGVLLNIVGFIACAVSGIFINEPTDGVTVFLIMLSTMIYPLFFIFGTILMVNKYYYNRRHWKAARIIAGIIMICTIGLLMIIEQSTNNMLLGLAAIYEMVCGIVVLANQNKILPEDVSLPEEDDDDEDEGKLSIYEPVRRTKIDSSSTTKTVTRQQASTDINSSVERNSALEIIKGNITIANQINHFSMSDIDIISNIENSTKKGKLFEEYVAKLLEYNSYTNISIIGGSGDLGGDIEARKANRKIIIQCKCYNGTVPYRAIQEVFSAARTRGGTPMVITNSHFSKQSIDNAEIQSVILCERSGLQTMIDIANEILDSEKEFERKHIEQKNIVERPNREQALRMLDEFEKD